MPLRVIAGKAKGRKLKTVPGDTTRPIMDKVKEALFSIIGPAIYGTSFLDLFAGTGSVGIEAISRGAAHSTFVDMERMAIQTIYDNLKSTGFEAEALVRRANAFDFLSQTPPRPYDYIYIAPPQYQSLWSQAMQRLDQNAAWRAFEPEIIVQIDPKEYHDGDWKYLKKTDERKYGNTLLCFFETNNDIVASDPDSTN
jgi:16S rRNA (guanine(966)-N(2))-methyltransferase RsmD